jgi:hypothetical protein
MAPVDRAAVRPVDRAAVLVDRDMAIRFFAKRSIHVLFDVGSRVNLGNCCSIHLSYGAPGI